jgi:putative oxidoreductase
MKNYQLLLMSVLLWSASSCVQKSYKKTVIITLVVNHAKDIKTVGIRGNGKPLSWDKDFPLKPLVKDSLYTLTTTVLTGYKFAEIKFTVNGEFELKERPNRRLVFSNNDTTYYNAVFNKEK